MPLLFFFNLAGGGGRWITVKQACLPWQSVTPITRFRHNFILCKYFITYTSGGSKGGARDAPPPPGAKILSFSCSFRPKNRFAHPLWELATPRPPPRGKSWIRHCIHSWCVRKKKKRKGRKNIRVSTCLNTVAFFYSIRLKPKADLSNYDINKKIS